MVNDILLMAVVIQSFAIAYLIYRQVQMVKLIDQELDLIQLRVENFVMKGNIEILDSISAAINKNETKDDEES